MSRRAPVPGMGRRALPSMRRFTAVLSLIVSMLSASGPMKAMPFFRHSRAKAAFSERKP